MDEHDNGQPKRKDAWDKLGLLGGPLIAFVGIAFTVQYNARQDQIKQLQANQASELARNQSIQASELARNQLVLQRLDVLGKYYSELMNQDKRRREFAIRVIKNAGDDELASRLTLQFDPKEQDKVFAELTTAPPPTTAVAAAGLHGWAYLGTYERSNRQWRTRYFDFSATASPADLIGTDQKVSGVTGDLNIRAGLPTVDGPMPKALAILVPGQAIHILSIRNWNNTGYHWAEVKYRSTKL
jgi:hypothetical protein